MTVQAGFLSQFFANVASDSLQNNGRGNSAIVNLQEKKIQGALAVMGHYSGKLDGDFDTLESRLGIKNFQKEFNLEPTGFLSNKEKSQLTYLSNLYTGLSEDGIEYKKRDLIFKEIDETIGTFDPNNINNELHSVYIVSDIEEGIVVINGKEISSIKLGYSPLHLTKGEYLIEIKKLSDDGEWAYSGKKSINVKKSFSVKIKSNKVATDKRKSKLYKENADKQGKALALWESSHVYNDNINLLVWEDSPVIASRRMLFSDAKKHCESLSFAYSNEWRLPNRAELSTLFNIQKKGLFRYSYGSRADIIFNVSREAEYVFSNVPNKGYGIHEKKYVQLKEWRFPFRCVHHQKKRDEIRNEIANKYGLNKYTDNIYVDTENNLAWENRLHEDYKSVAPETAIERCNTLDIDGIRGWKVPNSSQLRTLLKNRPAYSTFLEDDYLTKSYLSIKGIYAYNLDVEGKKTNKGVIYDSGNGGKLICVKKLN